MVPSSLLLSVLISCFCVPSTVNGESCQPNQTLAHPFNCSLYFICDKEGIPQQFSCYGGLHYNLLKQGCDLPENAKCEEYLDNYGYEGGEDDSGTYESYELPGDEQREDEISSDGVPEGELHAHRVPEVEAYKDEESKDELAEHEKYKDELPTDDVAKGADESSKDHPKNETMYESLKIDTSPDHEKSEIDETKPETVKEEHSIIKRNVSDFEVDQKEQSHNSSEVHHHWTNEEDSLSSVETEQENITQSDIQKVHDALASFIYLLSAFPTDAHKENATQNDYEWPLGYEQASGVMNIPEETSSHEPFEENKELPKQEDEGNKSTLR